MPMYGGPFQPGTGMPYPEMPKDDNKSEVTNVNAAPEKLDPPKLKVKRLDYYYSSWSKNWKYRNMSSYITVEERRPALVVGADDPWKDFAFVVIRTVPRTKSLLDAPTFKIVVKSPYLSKGLQDVIKYWPGISWNTDPLTLDPEMLLGFVPKLEEHAVALQAQKPIYDEDAYVAQTVNLLLDSLRTDYAETLSAVKHLVSHGEITFDYLYAIFVPQSILITECSVTGEPRAFRLVSHSRAAVGSKIVMQLTVESVDFTDEGVKDGSEVGQVTDTIAIDFFKGIVKITDLDAFPLGFHPQQRHLREKLLDRGHRWLGLVGIHHLQYNSLAVRKNQFSVLKHNIESRVMIDRAMFMKMNPQYFFPPVITSTDHHAHHQAMNGSAVSLTAPPVPPGTMAPLPIMPPSPAQPRTFGNPSSSSWAPLPPPLPMGLPGGYYVPGSMPVGNHPVYNSKTVKKEVAELTDEQLMLAPPIVYGFSLSDKLWLEFNIEHLSEIKWNDEAFPNLVLPDGQKELLRSLVEAHHQDTLQFDDFVTGKGLGLVVNLFGPPGVGKTFSAEATSEHVRKPLYVVGASDLKTDALGLDVSLEQIFNVAQEWKAIVLIDEADVFLEKRSLHDMFRNAAVSVFLRHIEYYKGILFLTTNRVKVFDEAFLSRIHVALHLPDLSPESKKQIWTAFLRKIKAFDLINEEDITRLAARENINGRQIKNAARTAKSLALARGEELSVVHLEQTLDAMNSFMEDFKKINE